MKYQPLSLTRAQRRASSWLLLFLLPGVAQLRALTPYSPDGNTLHLWHLDESATPCLDSAANGTNLTSLANGASLGAANASVAGFGSCLNTADGGQSGTAANQKDALLSVLGLADGSGDDVSLTLANPTTGAFTFEALVRVDFNPALNLSARNSGMQIFSGEGDGTTDRLFQWRIDPVGYGPGDITVPRLEFINLRQGGAIQSILVAVPTNGPNAIFSNQWYHVAVTYNGNDNTTDNFRAYWTSLTNAVATSANLLGTATMVSDLPVAGCDFVLGNEGRATGGSSDNFIGRIDEVRISNVARATNEFLFRSVVVLDASGYEAGTTNVPTNTLDGNLNSRWSALGDGQWIAYDLGRSELVQSLDVAFYLGNTRTASFDLLLSNDNVSWLSVLTNATSSGTTLNLEPYDFPDLPARYVRLVGHGNSQSAWNSITEVVLHRSPAADSDGDGLFDVWEAAYFGNLSQTGAGDPDGDSYDNLAEYAAGSNPTNALSTPLDTDADGLPDAWEQSCFGSLAADAGDDSDNDGYSNLEEFQAGTNPNNATSYPGALAVAFTPVNDGDLAASGFGYAGDTDDPINGVAFICSGLITVSNQQFMTYYGRHRTNASYALNNKLWVARRTLGAGQWEVFRTGFTAFDINDGHDVISSGIDGDGYLHVSWGMHGNSFLYAKSTAPVTGANAISFGPTNTMTGAENNVTYPQFLTMPNGDLLFLFRQGSSGAGDTFINRYSRATQTWTNQNYNAGLKPYIKGTGWSPDYNCYPNMPCLDADGNLSFVWVWRDTSAYQSNHDFNYARSTNGGQTWLRFDGSPYTLPISATGENGDPNTAAELIWPVPQNSSLINQAGMCLDQAGNPAVATWWAPGTGTNNYRRQYMVLFRDAGGWTVRQISQRTNDATGTIMQDGAVRDLGRPAIVCDPQGRLIVLYRDNFGNNGLTIAHTPPYALDPQRTNWTTFDLTTDNLGSYEPVIDLARWQRDNVLDVLYQPGTGHGYTAPANTASPIGVLEWNAAAYFAHRPTLRLSLVNSTNALLKFNAQPGWDYRVQTSANLTSWDTLVTLPGRSGQLQYTHTNSVGAGWRYWRIESREGGFGP